MKQSKKILYIISSLFFALVLFIYATSSSFQNSISIRQVTSETYSNTISNVPIDIKYDSERYFISGFTSEASVVLTGSNRVALSSEMQESTRKFHVVADLSNASEGTVEVQLKVENLPSGLSATVNPQKISVKIGKKASKKVPVKYLITGSQVAEDISITNVSLEHEEVTVTSDEETLEKINHVAAVLPSNVTISGNYSGAASLQAMDANGNVLPSVVTPFETTMKVTTKTTHSNSSSSKSSSSSNSSSK
ncbi:CdaR family protein [Streptococcus cristatus]|uniref:CdaR family protein n=1 Tax=Streptococcus cristatus TaxID=45634 RepID=UPI0028D683FB|nr:CdaR family protein [Streptococcus cristatus]